MVLGSARTGSGVAFIALSGPLGRLLIGRDADGAGAQLFIRAFGARDALLGVGTLLAIRTEQSARPWLIASGVADAFDAMATVTSYRHLPPKRRALTFMVSVIPAVLTLSTALRLADNVGDTGVAQHEGVESERSAH